MVDAVSFRDARELPHPAQIAAFLVPESLRNGNAPPNPARLDRRAPENVAEHRGEVRGTVLAADKRKGDALQGVKAVEGRDAYRLHAVPHDGARDQGHPLERILPDAPARIRNHQARRLGGIEFAHHRAAGEGVVAYFHHGVA